MPHLGGGKAIARRLREARATLRLFRVAVTEERSGSNTFFVLSRDSRESRENGESAQNTAGSRVHAPIRDEFTARCPVFPDSGTTQN